MKNNCLVSIIIPCYNSKNTIKKTIESIQAQIYPFFEVIFVDDGSVDETFAILKNYVEQDKRLHAYHINNSGVSNARNYGIDKANGKYILFVDADDIIDPTHIDTLIKVNNKYDVDTCFSLFTRNIESLGKFTQQDNKYIFKSQNEIMQTLMDEKFQLGFTSFLFKRSIIEQFTIRFPVGLKTGEDLEFLWTYLIHCTSGVKICKYTYLYIDNPLSAVHQVYWERTDSLESINRISFVMENNQCDFREKFKDYMTARYLWSYSKTFSIAKRKDYYNRLFIEYNVKDGMKYLFKNCKDKRVKYTSLLCIINKNLFYYVIGFIGGLT